MFYYKQVMPLDLFSNRTHKLDPSSCSNTVHIPHSDEVMKHFKYYIEYIENLVFQFSLILNIPLSAAKSVQNYT